MLARVCACTASHVVAIVMFDVLARLHACRISPSSLDGIPRSIISIIHIILHYSMALPLLPARGSHHLALPQLRAPAHAGSAKASFAAPNSRRRKHCIGVRKSLDVARILLWLPISWPYCLNFRTIKTIERVYCLVGFPTIGGGDGVLVCYIGPAGQQGGSYTFPFTIP